MGAAQYGAGSSAPQVRERRCAWCMSEEGLVGVFVGDVPTLGRDAPFEAFFPRDAAVG